MWRVVMKRTILLLGLWVIVTPIWILFCFYSGAGEDSARHTSFSPPETTSLMAFTPPALVLFGLAIWMCFAALNRLRRKVRAILILRHRESEAQT
jgi:hypothetical protein